MTRHRESGQTTVLVIGLALVVFAVAGIAIDGTRAFLLRRSMQSLADAAVLGGASEVDVGALYRGSETTPRLDEDSARRTAVGFLNESKVETTGEVFVTDARVSVVLRGRSPTTFLGLLGVRSIPVAVEAAAEPVAGETP